MGRDSAADWVSQCGQWHGCGSKHHGAAEYGKGSTMDHELPQRQMTVLKLMG
jgi:hypothetical protein